MVHADERQAAVFSFAPVVGEAPRVLILGSMPGERSLAAGQYYAHARNAFWPITGRILGFDADAPYTERLAALTDAGVALWDVLRSCVRPGSLDGSIERGSRITNDFPTFLAAHTSIRRICFNGGEAWQSFQRFVTPQSVPHHIDSIRLPSTSPANAALSFEQKLAIWRKALRLSPTA